MRKLIWLMLLASAWSNAEKKNIILAKIISSGKSFLKPPHFFSCFIAAFIFMVGICQASGPGNIDTTFNTGDVGFGIGDGADNNVHAVAVQADGKAIIGGDFTYFNGAVTGKVARLKTDGSLDSSFLATGITGQNTSISDIAVQLDGKIILAGNFSTFNGVSVRNLVRINSNGTLDSTFNAGGVGPNSNVASIYIQSDGKIVIGGGFTNYNNIERRYIARLNSNGTLDANFNSGSTLNATVVTVNVLSDDKILVGGSFTGVNGSAINRIAKLNSNGALDANFNPGVGANGLVTSLVSQPDGKILIAGQFTQVGSFARNRICRLNPDGSMDEGFDTSIGADNTIDDLALLLDGKIMIGGRFSTFSTIPANKIARLNTDGSLDNTYTPANINYHVYDLLYVDNKLYVAGAFFIVGSAMRGRLARLTDQGAVDYSFNPQLGANNYIASIAVDSADRIFAGGTFTSFNDTRTGFFTRLTPDGLLDNTFNTGGVGADMWVNTVSLYPDGRSVIGGQFNSYNGTQRKYIARIQNDGSLDTTFNPGTGANNYVWASAIQSDNKVLIGGQFTSYNGVSSLRLARLNSDGALDPTFNNLGVSNTVYSIAIQSDGKILIGGNFSQYGGNNRNALARINPDGSIDDGFSSITWGAPIYSIIVLSNGKILVGGDFAGKVARINSDGSLDNSFVSSVAFSVRSMLLQPDGKIVVAGNYVFSKSIARLNEDGSSDAGFLIGGGANDWVRSVGIQSSGKIVIGGSFISYDGVGKNRLARIYSGLDVDGDTFPDYEDAFPFDPLEWLDTDGDGIGNNADWDDDNDGVPDAIDANPMDAGNTNEVVLPLDGIYKGGSVLSNVSNQ